MNRHSLNGEFNCLISIFIYFLKLQKGTFYFLPRVNISDQNAKIEYLREQQCKILSRCVNKGCV